MIFWIEIEIFIFLVLSLALVSAFEFINWFHDTANAVAPVIYTKSLKAKKAVLIAWIMNFLWVVLWGIWVAMAIVHLLPLDIIWYQSTAFWIIVVISLLLSAIIWNFATWYFGIPASSSHSLIWAILGVTIMMMFVPIVWWLDVIPNWQKALDVIKSLFISPIIWFFLASAIMFLSYKFIKNKYYFSTPSKKGKKSPKIWLRSMLIWTSAWVSFAHGSNDWQKWVGLALLILVILAPSIYAVNPNMKISEINRNIISIENKINSIKLDKLTETNQKLIEDTKWNLESIKQTINSWENYDKMDLRETVLSFQKNIKKIEEISSFKSIFSSNVYASSIVDSSWIQKINTENKSLSNDINNDIEWIVKIIDYAPLWVIILISLSLWLWTMVWRKRIVVTIWEKIWKTDMNYAQATTSALMTAITISVASSLHLPVSTTHILSSSVAWTMSTWPDAWWVRKWTVRHILMAWVLTLPVTMFLSATIFLALWGVFVR